MTKISIEFFGFLKEKLPNKQWDLPLESPCSVAQFRGILAHHIADDLSMKSEDALKLLAPCAIASEEGILKDDEAIVPEQLISILPPVSGG
ncbi:MAG: hypothetical protein HRU09_12550 [Oligoflexales bacterium]|nr:hypothetical protein [Oligoflexales bacterium]